MLDLRPTYTHEALLKLTDLGYIKYVISQNTDGLHRLSGIPESKISELHGNAFMEKCEKCGNRYEWCRQVRRRADVPANTCERCGINHRTGGICQDKVSLNDNKKKRLKFELHKNTSFKYCKSFLIPRCMLKFHGKVPIAMVLYNTERK